MPSAIDQAASIMGCLAFFPIYLTVAVLTVRQANARGERVPWRVLFVMGALGLLPLAKLIVVFGNPAVISAHPFAQDLRAYFNISEWVLFIGLLTSGVRQQNPTASVLAILVLSNAIWLEQSGADPLEGLAFNLLLQAIGFDELLRAMARVAWPGEELGDVTRRHIARLIGSVGRED